MDPGGATNMTTPGQTKGKNTQKTSKDRTAIRLLERISRMDHEHPNAFKIVNELHQRRGSPQLSYWPEWCYVPSLINPIDLPEDDQEELILLAAWRLGMGIYRFDPDLLAELWRTPVTGNIPSQILFRLPEWAVYIEAPPGNKIKGAFAYLNWSYHSEKPQIEVSFDYGRGTLSSLVIDLDGTLEEGVNGFIQITREAANIFNLNTGAGSAFSEERLRATSDHMFKELGPFLSCLLYLCSQNADYQPPSKPQPIMSKKGPKLFPAYKAKIWEVGARVGPQLRAAKARAEAETSGTEHQREGHTKRPHLRRAHWSTYWLGPRNGPEPQKPIARWIMPLLINIDPDEDQHLPGVIHPVEK